MGMQGRVEGGWEGLQYLQAWKRPSAAPCLETRSSSCKFPSLAVLAFSGQFKAPSRTSRKMQIVSLQ